MIISDDQVYPLYGDDHLTFKSWKKIKSRSCRCSSWRKIKRFDMLPALYKVMLDFKLTRIV